MIAKSCAAKQSVGSKSNRHAARRAFLRALESLDALEKSIIPAGSEIELSR